ncbi:MAG: Gfo/Idh/MocA family oxidoreductase [Desulfobacteraceae bacterium]|nr:Gfo/Idh/MocA family oxidoreductase [Desulfobacteraceae bacterium]
MNVDDKVKLGMLSFAHVHASNYAQVINALNELSLIGIWDDNKYRGRCGAVEFDTEYYDDLDRLLDEADGIIVTSENAFHKELVERASEAGKHILCEKPIATTLKDADTMIQACKESGVRLHIAFPMRYAPAVQALKEEVRAGNIGDLFGISSTNHGKLPPGWFQDEKLAGGGAVMDHSVHLVDLFRWIFNQEITEVYAEVGILLHDIAVEDCGLLSLEFEDRGFATLDCSWSRPECFPTWGDLTMRVYGTNGVLEVEAFKQGLVSYSDRWKSAKWEYWGTNPDLEMLRDFAKIVKGERPKGTLATGEDGKKALAVALAAYHSVRERKPVHV